MFDSLAKHVFFLNVGCVLLLWRSHTHTHTLSEEHSLWCVTHTHACHTVYWYSRVFFSIQKQKCKSAYSMLLFLNLTILNIAAIFEFLLVCLSDGEVCGNTVIIRFVSVCWRLGGKGSHDPNSCLATLNRAGFEGLGVSCVCVCV